MTTLDPQKKGPTRPYRILLVEDSDADAQLFERSLTRLEGFNITSRVSDGQAAIAYLEGKGDFADRERFPFPDIMILDLKLPNADGFTVLEWARGRSSRPIIAVFSVCDGEVTRRRAQQLGADLYENKIWNPPVFDRFLHFVGNMAEAKARFEI